MNSIQKKIVAGIGIYEVVLITFVLVFEPYGSRMSSREWDNFWLWSLALPIAALAIFYLFNWGFGKNINIFKFQKSNKKLKFNIKKIMVDFFNGKLSLAVSFWVFGFLGSALMGIIGVVVFKNIIIGRIIAIPWQLYALIGIWSSADKYKGPKALSILAKVFIVLWIINNFGKLIYS